MESRWLVCAVASVAVHWCLLLDPSKVLQVTPALWSVEGGSHNHDPPAPAAEPPRRPIKDLTPEELLQQFMRDLEKRKTPLDKTKLFFIGVILWFGIAFMVAQPLMYYCGPQIKGTAARLWRALRPLLRYVPLLAVTEVACYIVAFTVAAQGCRYPTDRGVVPAAVSLVGVVAFVLSWAFSTAVHASKHFHSRERLVLSATAAGSVLTVAVAVPLALKHSSPVLGTPILVAVHLTAATRSWLMFADRRTVVRHCALTAMSIGAVVWLVPRLFPAVASWFRPFSLGAAVFGHVTFMLAMLVLSSRWWPNQAEFFLAAQAWMVASLAMMLFLGWWLPSPALVGTATTFTLLWLLQKQWEVKWDNLGVKLLATYVILRFLYNDAERVLSILEPQGLYI